MSTPEELIAAARREAAAAELKHKPLRPHEDAPRVARLITQWDQFSDIERKDLLLSLRAAAIETLGENNRAPKGAEIGWRGWTLRVVSLIGPVDFSGLEALQVKERRMFSKALGLKPADIVVWHESGNIEFLEAIAIAMDSIGSPSQKQAVTLVRACLYVQRNGMTSLMKDLIVGSYQGLEDDLLMKGRAFAPGGRKAGAVGPVRKAIRAYLKRWPAATNAEIWEAFRANAPRGLAVTGKAGKALSEIFVDKLGSKDYVYFCNRAAEERALLKQPKGFTE